MGYSYFMLRMGESPEDFWHRLEIDNAGGEPIPDKGSFSVPNRTMAEIGEVVLKRIPGDDPLIHEFLYGPEDRVRPEVSARLAARLGNLLASDAGDQDATGVTRPSLDPELREVLTQFARLCKRGGNANGLVRG